MMIRAAMLLSVCVAGTANAATPSDLRDYALAECLIKQTVSPDLRDEGYRLGEIVLYRAGIAPGRWKSLDRAVDAEFARRPMTTTHVDAPVARSDKPVPIAHCLAVIDAPRVRAAMAGLRSKGRPRR